jgi:hypothetical protein
MVSYGVPSKWHFSSGTSKESVVALRPAAQHAAHGMPGVTPYRQVNAALPHRRMRGLDLLYSVRNGQPVELTRLN